MPREDHFQDVSISGTLSLAAGAVIAPGVNFKDINNIRYANAFGGDDAGEKIAAAITDLPSTGGIVDARGLEGAQTIASTVTISKSVTILLGYAVYTTSASPAFDFVNAGDHSSLIGVGKGSTTSGGTRIIAASSGVTPVIRILGTDASNRAIKLRLQDLTIEGSANSDGQIGISYKFFTDIKLVRVQFVEIGQAEDIDMGALLGHFDINYHACGTGGTAATACVRIENRAGGGILNQVWWDWSLWEGDTVAGNNKQGTAIYFTKGAGGENNTHRLSNSFLDYDGTNPDFPIVFLDDIAVVQIGKNIISASSIVTANAVVDVTGSSGNVSDRVQIFNNTIAFSDTVPAVRFDWGNLNELIGGTMRGAGSGTAVEITSNHGTLTVGPFQMASTDTPVSNSSTTTVTFFREQTSGNAWHMPEGLAVGAIPATSGVIRLGNNEIVRGRNAANSANKNMIFLGTDDTVHLGESGVPTEIKGDLDHDGSKVGFYAAVPASQASAEAALTGTPGTADGAMATISGSGDDANINNNFQEVQDKVNAALAALRGVGLIAT